MQRISFGKVKKIDESAQFRLELNSHEKNCEGISIRISDFEGGLLGRFYFK